MAVMKTGRNGEYVLATCDVVQWVIRLTVIGAAGHIDPLGRNFTKNSNRDALRGSKLASAQPCAGSMRLWQRVAATYRSWKWVSHHQVLCNTQLTTQLSNFIFEELSQWLNQSQALALGHAFR